MRPAVLAIFLVIDAITVSGQQPAKPLFAFVSDTQKPMWIEDVFLHSNQNLRATELIFSDILAQKPGTLFILGDVVSLGYKEKRWSAIDKYMRACRDSGIYVTALLGNHDVMRRPEKGTETFQKRFADHVRTGFVRVMDSVGVVLLNSNFTKLTAGDRAAQQQWYLAKMKELDDDPAIATIIVTCHHAPYTNSRIVGSDVEVQRNFVPAYLKSSKARLFITGHSHNFESFEIEGKRFLVIGGGGGIHQPLRKTKILWSDLIADYKPMFHYVLVTESGKKLMVVSRFLKDDFSGFETGRTLVIP